MGDERPDDWTSTRNFHKCYACVRTMRGSSPDGWSRIGNFHISCTRVRTKADWRPDGDIWIAILALRRRASGRDTTSSGRLNQSSYIWTWKESEAGRVLIGVRTCCWVVRTDASWIETSRHNVGSERKCTSSGRMEQWSDGRPDGWQGTEIFDLSRSAKSSESALNSESLFTASLHTQVILFRMRPKY
jgi:hypothetical protein